MCELLLMLLVLFRDTGNGDLSNNMAVLYSVATYRHRRTAAAGWILPLQQLWRAFRYHRHCSLTLSHPQLVSYLDAAIGALTG